MRMRMGIMNVGAVVVTVWYGVDRCWSTFSSFLNELLREMSCHSVGYLSTAVYNIEFVFYNKEGGHEGEALLVVPTSGSVANCSFSMQTYSSGLLGSSTTER
jgi:hypothetical protein